VTAPRRARVLRFACVVALLALGLVVWSLVDPRPVPVVVAMSLGQALGTLSFGAYLAVVLADLRARDRRGPRPRA